MSPDQSNADAVASPVEPTIPSSSTTEGQPDYRAKYEEWQKRAAGFQSAFQKEQEAKAAALSKAQEFELKFQQLSLQVGELEKERDALREERDRAATDYDVAQSELALKNAVISDAKYEPLIPFLRDGLLPSAGSAEELVPVLEKFLANISVVVTSRAETVAKEKIDEQKGATPPSPNGNSPTDKEALRKEAFASLRAGDQRRYEELIAKAKQIP